MALDPVTALRNFEFLDDEDFVTAPEFASLCGVRRQSVAAWIRGGQLPATEGREHASGRLYKIRVADARRLLASMGASDVE